MLSDVVGWNIQLSSSGVCNRQCGNYQRCVNTIDVSATSTSAVVSQFSVITLSLPFTMVQSCACSTGFNISNGCINEINECDPNPCHYGGECVDLLGDYLCKCPTRTAGKDCSHVCPSSRRSKCSICSPNPCLNGGTCEVQSGQPICDCPEGYVGKWCELTGIHVERGAYVELPPLRHRVSVNITYSFSSVSPNGLLLYASKLERERGRGGACKICKDPCYT